MAAPLLIFLGRKMVDERVKEIYMICLAWEKYKKNRAWKYGVQGYNWKEGIDKARLLKLLVFDLTREPNWWRK